MVMSGSVVVGCTVNTKWSGGLSANTVASHALGAPMNHVHCGSADPTADVTVYSPSVFSAASDIVMRGVKPAGPFIPYRPDIETPHASAPAPIAMAPGSAVAAAEAEAAAEW